MKTFYAVTAGRYSDYHIIAITDNKEHADNIAKIYSDDGWNSDTQVEEFFDSESKDEAFYDVRYKTNGSYDVGLQELNKNYKFDNINIIEENASHNNWWKYRVLVMAKSKDHAIKIAQDLWAEHKAKKEGIV